jgi:hypothetical protein
LPFGAAVGLDLREQRAHRCQLFANSSVFARRGKPAVQLGDLPLEYLDLAVALLELLG